MAQNRKLQAEIERTLKRVAEGLLEFEEIWQRVYSAPTTPLKEKHEADLKKEIKKLQRYRDQIKTWLSSSEIRDKDDLLTARKQIERDMERFKVCEKETKTKAFSKEALNNTPKKKLLDKPKLEVKDWIDSRVSKLRGQLEERESQLDREQRRGKKRNKQQDCDQIDDLQRLVEKYKFHIEHLEMAWEMLFEDEIQISDFNEVQDDVDFFVENNQEEEMQNFDDTYIYDLLKQRRGQKVKPDTAPPPFESELDNTDSGVDGVNGGDTAASKPDDGDDGDDVKDRDSGDLKGVPKQRKKSGASPHGSGVHAKLDKDKDARKKDKESRKKDKAKPTKDKVKPAPAIQVSSNYTPVTSKGSKATGTDHVSPVAAAAKPSRPPLVPPESSATATHTAFANVVKQQKQAEQKAKAAAAAQAQAQAQAKAKQLAQQQAQEAKLVKKGKVRSPQSRTTTQPISILAARAPSPKSAVSPSEAAVPAEDNTPSLLTPLEAASEDMAPPSLAQQISTDRRTEDDEDIRAHASGASSRDQSPFRMSPPPQTFDAPLSAEQKGSLDLLEASIRHMPGAIDSERPKQYLPRNPYNTPAHFPSSPSPIFEDPSFFEKYDTDTLFFIFYFQQGTYQQYLAARQLKKQSWRYHTKYLTWFQRHEDPQVTTDEHEQGTYVYFDYDHSWCQRIKAEFTFEYRFLEDELV